MGHEKAEDGRFLYLCVRKDMRRGQNSQNLPKVNGVDQQVNYGEPNFSKVAKSKKVDSKSWILWLDFTKAGKPSRAGALVRMFLCAHLQRTGGVLGQLLNNALGNKLSPQHLSPGSPCFSLPANATKLEYKSNLGTVALRTMACRNPPAFHWLRRRGLCTLSQPPLAYTTRPYLLC